MNATRFQVGYKFETLALIPATWAETSRNYIESRESLVVRNYAQYCSVVRTGFGKSRLILAGEVDALWDAKPCRPDDPINWVELKTAATPLSDRDVLKYERKLLKFWIQSFLLGVPKIIVGFRNKEGLKSTIVGEGVWRIRKREKGTVIETFRIEESGHGNILSRDFLTWRSQSGQGHVS
ncbi:MAG: hypothetical protein Q9205_001040 [Flavoplaca limonia]